MKFLWLLESRMNEIAAKADRMDEMASCLEAMPVCKLMNMVEVLEDKATTVGGFESRDSSTGSIVRVEEHVEGLNNVQQAIF